jgi:hypothetical protein
MSVQNACPFSLIQNFKACMNPKSTKSDGCIVSTISFLYVSKYCFTIAMLDCVCLQSCIQKQNKNSGSNNKCGRVNSSVHILCRYVPVQLLRWMILIGLQIIFINFSILNIICGQITITHLPIYIYIIWNFCNSSLIRLITLIL